MRLLLSLLLCSLLAACNHDHETGKVNSVESRAEMVKREIQRRHASGQDVSAVLAQAKQAAALGRQGRVAEVSALLDDIIEILDAMPPVEAGQGPFSSIHQRVTIKGYDDHAMEPFLSRDGKILFFNNSNASASNTNIHYATRMDDLRYLYRGEVSGINTRHLEGVPTMDSRGNFYFTSTREYPQTLKTVFSGRFKGGKMSNVRAVEGLSLKKQGWLNMDSEISADGQTLYSTHSRFSGKSYPVESNLFVAVKNGDGFTTHPRSSEIVKNLNSRHLEYAVAISADEKEIFFTRLNLDNDSYVFQILRSTRNDKNHAFEKPGVLTGFQGLVEAPTLSPGGGKLYYHKKVAGVHRIYMAER